MRFEVLNAYQYGLLRGDAQSARRDAKDVLTARKPADAALDASWARPVTFPMINAIWAGARRRLAIFPAISLPTP